MPADFPFKAAPDRVRSDALRTPGRRRRVRAIARLRAGWGRAVRRTPLLSRSHCYLGGGRVLDLRSGSVRRPQPDFLILGAMKCGTSSLYSYLDQHPDLFGSPIKEPGYFLRPADTRLRPEYRTANEIRRGLDDAALLRLMLHGYRGERIFFEGSTHYTKIPEHGTGVPERCHAANPRMKFLYMIRNPFDRIVSQYLHAMRRGASDRDLAATLADDDLYLQISRYAFQIEPYVRRFGTERIRLVVMEELVRNPERTLREVFRFLGVEERATDTTRVVNVSDNRSQFAREELRFPPEAYERLLAVFDREIRRLEELFGVDLGGWDLSKERHVCA